MDENKIEQLVKKLVEQQQLNKKMTKEATVSLEDYPLQKNKPHLVSSFSGKTLADITLQKVVNEEIVPDDIKISAEVLELQAQIAQSSGKVQFAQNLRRAAEMTRIPDAKVLEIYEQLRPRRATFEQLMEVAQEIESNYSAKITAQLIRNAAEVYKNRKVLKS